MHAKLLWFLPCGFPAFYYPITEFICCYWHILTYRLLKLWDINKSCHTNFIVSLVNQHITNILTTSKFIAAGRWALICIYTLNWLYNLYFNNYFWWINFENLLNIVNDLFFFPICVNSVQKRLQPVIQWDYLKLLKNV